MEFVLIMMLALIFLFVPVIELIRISAFDQMLAQATHRATRAAAALEGNDVEAVCEGAIETAFQEHAGLGLGLLDQDGDGTVSVVFDNPDADAEVRVWVRNMHLSDDSPTPDERGCGTGGAFIRVWSTIEVAPWTPMHIFWDGATRSAQSLARNQTATM